MNVSSQFYCEEEYTSPACLFPKIDWVILFVCSKNESPHPLAGEKYKFCQQSLICFSLRTYDFFLFFACFSSPQLPRQHPRYHRLQAIAQKGHQRPSFHDSKRICNDLTPCPSSPITYCHWFLKGFRKGETQWIDNDCLPAHQLRSVGSHCLGIKKVSDLQPGSKGTKMSKDTRKMMNNLLI